MGEWKFPSRGYAATEGFSDAGLAEFRGDPLKALARELCQNSLDAADGSGRPVKVEFQDTYMEVDKFPGMNSMKKTIKLCEEFWGEKGDINTKNFLKNAKRELNKEKFVVLRVSDFNTKGVEGAFSDAYITPWGSLVKGNAFSVKSDEKNAAGSFGIGKAAPFVSSYFQTVFYRTFEKSGVRAAMGVSHLMAHKIPEKKCLTGEDPIRRSIGYYGENADKKPSRRIAELDDIFMRKQHGTDLFIPGFIIPTNDDEYEKKILVEIVDNFLYSIYSGKLEVTVGARVLNKNNLEIILNYLGKKAKNANIFYKVINENNKDVIEEKLKFHSLGTLKLRLLYENDLNRKILVVRNSGMKIAKIPSLPRGISYTGFLELQGEDLNEFFRGMENPRHDAWEPKRHKLSGRADVYKCEVEEWVRNVINEKLVEISGEESLIDVGDCFNYVPNDTSYKNNDKKEQVIDTVKNIEIIEDTPIKNRLKIKDIGGGEGKSSRTVSGIIDDKGTSTGHRHRTGTRSGGNATGRKGRKEDNGEDTIYDGQREVYVSARIISKDNGTNRLIYTTEENISMGEMQIVSRCENGKTIQLFVKEAKGENISVKDGHIVISNIQANVKQVVEFKIVGNKKFAMGVKAYGN